MNKNGFTLLEIIFVLGIWSLLLLLSTPILFTVLNKQQEEQFFRTFEFDILYMQNISYATHDYIRLTFNEEIHSYTISHGSTNETLIERKIPQEWEIDKRTMIKPVSFNSYGVIRQPGTLFIKTEHSVYRIVFPLGKGRCYIEEQ